MDVSLDAKTHAELIARAKKQIRARMGSLRRGHSAASLRARSERLVERLLQCKQVKDAGKVALFWPIEGRGEVDLRPLDVTLRERGAQVFYPFMDPLKDGGFRTGFRETSSAEDLHDRGRKFLEPHPEARVAQRGDVDLVIVPALAADMRGHRIGYGAGYYDATLCDVCPPAASLIAIYQFQMMAELPTEPHDVACTCVVTDENTYEVPR